MSRTIKNTFISFIVFLLILAWWSSLNIGLSGDEYSHHINGLKRFNFLITLGEAKNYHFYNNELYPGIYDTLSYALGLIIFLINDEFYANNIDFVMHLINITFSSLSILGLYLLTQCKHYVVTTSSFNWWGAWLSPNQNKIIIRPSNFKNFTVNNKDLWPKKWLSF